MRRDNSDRLGPARTADPSRFTVFMNSGFSSPTFRATENVGEAVGYPTIRPKSILRKSPSRT
jgi:hypothetical protein